MLLYFKYCRILQFYPAILSLGGQNLLGIPDYPDYPDRIV
jgi:hypothetical protein